MDRKFVPIIVLLGTNVAAPYLALIWIPEGLDYLIVIVVGGFLFYYVTGGVYTVCCNVKAKRDGWMSVPELLLYTFFEIMPCMDVFLSPIVYFAKRGRRTG